MRTVLCLLLVAACVGPGVSCTTNVCDPNNRNGSYAVTYTRDPGDAGGTCPVPTNRVVQIEEPSDLAGASSCTVNEGAISGSYCRQGIDATCAVSGGGSLHLVVELTDTNGNGSSLVGIEQVTYTGTANDCTATFDFVAKKQ